MCIIRIDTADAINSLPSLIRTVDFLLASTGQRVLVRKCIKIMKLPYCRNRAVHWNHGTNIVIYAFEHFVKYVCAWNTSTHLSNTC